MIELGFGLLTLAIAVALYSGHKARGLTEFLALVLLIILCCGFATVALAQ